jgi:hypothetical protein
MFIERTLFNFQIALVVLDANDGASAKRKGGGYEDDSAIDGPQEYLDNGAILRGVGYSDAWGGRIGMT